MSEAMAFHGVHPGRLLKEELEARGLSATAFGLKLRVPPQRIHEIVAGRRAISPETALRIGRALGTGARLWLAMQQAYDLWKADHEHGDRVRREVEAERYVKAQAARATLGRAKKTLAGAGKRAKPRPGDRLDARNE